MTDREFTELASGYLDDHAQRHPDSATALGDHRFDAHLPDRSADALADERHTLNSWALQLGALDTDKLSAEHQVDVAIMANNVARRVFEIDELREHTWNPLRANPGRAIYMLLARDFAPLPDRLESVAGRLAEIPATLTAARSQLESMPRVHLETPIGQFDGTINLIGTEIDAALAAAEQSAADLIGRVGPAALEALAEHRDWLGARPGDLGDHPPGADPRIGAERFARKLSLTLNAAADADAILARARADLDQVTEEITSVAASLGGSVREVLDRLAADAPDDPPIPGFWGAAARGQTRLR